jgi:hypothetical protein
MTVIRRLTLPMTVECRKLRIILMSNMDQVGNEGHVFLVSFLTILDIEGNVTITDSRFGPSNNSLEYRR